MCFHCNASRKYKYIKLNYGKKFWRKNGSVLKLWAISTKMPAYTRCTLTSKNNHIRCTGELVIPQFLSRAYTYFRATVMKKLNRLENSIGKTLIFFMIFILYLFLLKLYSRARTWFNGRKYIGDFNNRSNLSHLCSLYNMCLKIKRRYKPVFIYSQIGLNTIFH